jgi:hypothetical protein
MNHIEEQFNRAYSAKGGRLNEDHTDFSFFNQFKEGFVNAVELIKLDNAEIPNIHIDIIDCVAFQATAKLYENKYFIGITTGSILTIYDMFLKMFATKSVLPHLGNVFLETDEEKKINISGSGGSVTFGLFSQSFYSPKGVERQTFTMLYSNLALLFLILHECGHIVKGHLAYISKELNTHDLNELNNNYLVSIIGALNLQTLEMDADSFALNACFKYANAVILEKFIIWEIEKEYIYNDWSSYLKHLGFVVYSFFRLFANDKTSLDTVHLDSHPPPIVRATMIGANLYTILIKCGGIDTARKFGIEFKNGCKEAEIAFCSVTYSTSKIEEFSSVANSEEYNKYRMEVLENWNNVRPKLEPHCFVPLQPLKTNADLGK